MTENESHPIAFLYDLLNLYGGTYTLSFSRYFYRPQSPIDEREVFTVSSDEIDGDWLRIQLEKLDEGWELALNSRVIDSRNRAFHIPMIDFVGRNGAIFFSGEFRDILGKRYVERMRFYDSGRSYHSYLLMLTTRSEWVNFMGSLLLLNFPGAPPNIDARWVGHRLRAGYSALRWSASTSNYLKEPSALSLDGIFRETRRIAP